MPQMVLMKRKNRRNLKFKRNKSMRKIMRLNYKRSLPRKRALSVLMLILSSKRPGMRRLLKTTMMGQAKSRSKVMRRKRKMNLFQSLRPKRRASNRSTRSILQQVVPPKMPSLTIRKTTSHLQKQHFSPKKKCKANKIKLMFS